jgi:hypothetical protein
MGRLQPCGGRFSDRPSRAIAQRLEWASRYSASLTRGELDSRPPDSVVRAREPDLLPPSGERQSRKRHRAAAPVLLHGTLTGNSRQYSGISGLCVERGLWPRLDGGERGILFCLPSKATLD